MVVCVILVWPWLISTTHPIQVSQLQLPSPGKLFATSKDILCIYLDVVTTLCIGIVSGYFYRELCRYFMKVFFYTYNVYVFTKKIWNNKTIRKEYKQIKLQKVWKYHILAFLCSEHYKISANRGSFFYMIPDVKKLLHIITLYNPHSQEK